MMKNQLKIPPYVQKQQTEMINRLNNPKQLSPEFIELLSQSHLAIVKRKKGEYRVDVDVINPDTPLTVISMRNYLMMGYKPLKVTYDTPRLIYKLIKGKDQLLMSDSPQEMFLHYDAYKEATGRVLTSGLGLGLFANMVARKKDVREVVVVEIEEDIINLCRPSHNKIRIIHDDIWNFLKNTDEKFDYIYIDIHYTTGALEYVHTVLHMHKILKKRFKDIPSRFWGEEEMKSQYIPNFDKKIEDWKKEMN